MFRLNYSLAIIRRAYNEFADRAGRMKRQRGAKTALVQSAIDSFTGQFTLTDLERACPGVSRDLIRRLLWQMRKANRVECLERPGERRCSNHTPRFRVPTGAQNAADGFP